MKLAIEILLVIVCVSLILIVLLQSGKSYGLSAITGGAEQLFGKTKARGMDAALNIVTTVLAVLFMVLTVALAFIFKS